MNVREIFCSGKRIDMAFELSTSLPMLTLLFLASYLKLGTSEEASVVNTTYGPVRGKAIVLNTNKTLVQYLGIPFAQAKRFQAPESPKPWTVPLNATSFGFSCWQSPSKVVNSSSTMREDCLTVNVFLPENKAKAVLPVMVWIYGGGFAFGSSAYYLYNGGYLATEGEVVVVTFNYRLGVLGFLSTGTKDLPGNYGLLDQVKALQWVQENINSFGGDPKQVTIFGQSAGAASVALHMLSPLSSGLYHKVILQSGTAATTFAAADNKKAVDLARTLSSLLGCSLTGLKDCLLAKNASEIMKAQQNITQGLSISGSSFLPVADNHFLPDLPFNLLVKGQFSQPVPVMIGVTKNEGGFFVIPIEGLSTGIPGINNGLNKTAFDSLISQGQNWVYNQTQRVLDSVIFEYTDWTNESNPLVLRQQYMDVITDASFKAPAVRSAQEFVKNNMTTYFYCFDHSVSSLLKKWPWVGVFHGADIKYVFGRPLVNYNLSADEADQDVEIQFSKKIMTMWSDFAKKGNPTPNSTQSWPEYSLQSKQYMSLSPSMSVQNNMLPEKMAFWNLFIPALTEPGPTMVPSSSPVTRATISPTGEKEAAVGKGTEYALTAVVVVLAILLLVLMAVVWRLRRKLGNALYDPGPTTRLI